MDRKNIAVLGKYDTENDLHFYHMVLDCLQDQPAVNKTLTIKDEVDSAYIRGDSALLDIVLELVVGVIEDADAVVVTACKDQDSHSKAVGWVVSYCYGLGIPVVLVTGEGNFVELPFIVARTIHAHVDGLAELAVYDFDTLPVKVFKGYVM